ncbi:YceD family protein [Alistipes sp.]|uniref:YceD family protein n=1 Tax=Alistipes sp. TaxID=1872444 RepID=UPI003AB67277
MEEAKRYTIAYKGLKSGLHDFHFEVDGSLFKAFGSTEIKDGACGVTVVMERGEAMLTLDVTVDGSVVVECDRCLEDCRVLVHYEGQLLVKFSDEVREYDGEVMWLLPMEDEIDLTQYIYESIVLALPYQRVHPDGECNPEMLKRFRIVSDAEFGDIEARAEEEHAGGEWAKLAALKERMEAEEAQDGHVKEEE